MRAATAGEKVRLRTRPQWVELRLAALENPPVVFAAQVNQASFGTTEKPYDQIAQATFDNITTGAYTDPLPGMSMYVGSTPGAYDLGIVRVRKAFGAATAYFGEVSDVAWADDIYITVVDDMDLWSKHVRIVNQVPYIDYDVAYTNQHDTLDPVPVMGADKVVDTETYPVVVELDSSLSWVIGSAISSHAWTASAGSLADPNTSTPTLTINSYPANGRIRLKCTVTAANGKSFAGYRYIYVYDTTNRPLVSKFVLDSCEGDYEDGGWSFDLTLLDNVSLTNVRNRTKVILYAVDHYGKTDADLVSVGQVAGSENIVAMGWVDGNSIKFTSQASVVSFTVRGPNFWLDKMPGFPPGVEIRKGGVTAGWTNISDLTVDKTLWHLLHWRSTATAVIDVILTDDTRVASAFEVPTESLWAQMVEIAETSIFAHPCCNRHGQLFVEVDANLVPEADRTWPTVMEIETQDMAEQVEFERLERTETAMLDLSGVAVGTNGKGVPYFSLANGHIFKHFGEIEIADRLLLEDQDQANALAGLAMGKMNNIYPDWTIKLWANNRMFDVAPRSFASVTITSASNLRGIAYTGNLIPRNVAHVWEEEGGKLKTELNRLEAETFPEISITGDRPSESSIPPVDDPPTVDDPPPVEDGDPPLDGPPDLLIATYDTGFLFTNNGNEADSVWSFMNAGLTTAQYAGAGSTPRIKQVVKTPSGALFALILDYDDALYQSDGRGGTHIFWAAGLGAAWSLLHYVGDVTGASDPADKARFVCIAADPMASEHIVAIGGASGIMRVLSGDRNGLTEVASTLDSRRRLGSAVLNSANWLIFHAEDNTFSSRAWSLVTSAYSITTNASNDFGSLGSAADRNHWAILCGDKVAYWTYGNELAFISNNDPTAIASSYNSLASESSQEVLQCYLCASPDGTHLMGGGSSVIGQRSTDGGATFGNIGTGGGMGIGYRVWANAGNDLQWLAATAQKVMRTLDGGDNWEDVSGDLPTIAPLCGITHLLVIG